MAPRRQTSTTGWILAASAAAWLTAAAARAQANAPAAAALGAVTTLEKFAVTGSYLPQSALAPAMPVSTLTSDEMDRTGVVGSLLDVLRKTAPQFTGNGNLGVNNANTSGGVNNGGTQISFRNLPTLVLLNGRRLPYSPVSSTGGGLFVDVNMIPVAAIGKVEIVQDGGSALYGSDAIAGVVNIILKHDLQGFEVRGKYSFSKNPGHYEERLVSIAGGLTRGPTSVTVAAEWFKSDPLYLSQRSFSRPIYGTSSFAGILNIGGAYYYLNPSLTKPPAGPTPIATLVADGVYSGPYTSTEVQSFYDVAGPYGSTLQASNQRKSATLAVEHKFNDRVSFFGSALVARTDTAYRLNAQGFSAPLPVGLVGNPTTTPITIRNRYYLHPRLYLTTNRQLGVLAGLKGSLADWTWETAVNYGEIRQDYHNPGLISNAALIRAVLSGALDLSSTAPDAADAVGIFGAARIDQVSKLWTVDAKAAGQLLALPAGAVNLAIGGQFYQESIAADADRGSNVATFDWNGGVAISPFVASRRVSSVFAELQAPIFNATQKIAGAYTLNLDAQVRHDAYSDTKKPTTPKYNVRWQPFDQQLTVRASWSTGFRAPKLYDLFGPVSQAFTSTASYQGYDAAGKTTVTFAGQGHTQSGANGALGPSTAENFSGGFVYSPRRLKGLAFTVDYFHVNQYNVVGTLGATNIIASVEQLGPASPYASKVRLAPLGASNDPKWFTQGAAITASGQISALGLDSTYVSDTKINLGGTKTDGADVRIGYTKAIASLGRFDFTTTATIYHHYRIKNLPTDPYVEYAGGVSGIYNTIPDWRTYTTVDFTRGPWFARLGHLFIPSVEDLTNHLPVGSYSQLDARMAYGFNREFRRLKGLSIAVDVSNVFNRFGPASAANTDSHVDTGIYGAVGRQITLELGTRF